MDNEKYYFDETDPLKVKRFLETYCRQSQGDWCGKPLKLFDWQYDRLLKPLYGVKHRLTHLNRYKKAGIWVPKKQGKSTLLSGLCLWHLLKEKGSKVYCIAKDREQAKIVFAETQAMVEQHPALKKRLKVLRNSIEDRNNFSTFKVLSGAPKGKSGFNASFIALDELADWEPSKARDVWDQLDYASIARTNALQIVISTAQFDRTSLGYEQYRFAKDALLTPDSPKHEHFLPLIYEVEEHEDWQNENLWWKANPSAGVTVPKDDWRQAFNRAKDSPREEAKFRTLRLNQWVGHCDSFIGAYQWGNCYEAFDEKELYGLPAYIGIDMARKYDLASYSILIPKGDKCYVISKFFIPKEFALQKQKLDNVPYLAWEENPLSHLYLTPGNVIEHSFIRGKINEDAKKFKILRCGYDPYMMEETRQILQADGLDMVEVNQQSIDIMPPAIAHLERMVQASQPSKDGAEFSAVPKLRHNNNPVLNYCVGNCVVRTLTDGKGITLDKRKATGRIDGVSSLAIAITQMIAPDDYQQVPLFFG